MQSLLSVVEYNINELPRRELENFYNKIKPQLIKCMIDKSKEGKKSCRITVDKIPDVSLFNELYKDKIEGFSINADIQFPTLQSPARYHVDIEYKN